MLNQKKVNKGTVVRQPIEGSIPSPKGNISWKEVHLGGKTNEQPVRHY